MARNSFLSSKSLLLEKSRNSSEMVHPSKTERVSVVLVQVTPPQQIGREEVYSGLM